MLEAFVCCKLLCIMKLLFCVEANVLRICSIVILITVRFLTIIIDMPVFPRADPFRAVQGDGRKIDQTATNKNIRNTVRWDRTIPDYLIVLLMFRRNILPFIFFFYMSFQVSVAIIEIFLFSD